ncbi:ABC transporter ATP-binding protein [Zwartia sp.]|uniref:ABC transporter ATP-binding protein n=1 Tax=Zwartia sp. TaxID=2978004 RepID=UPI0027252B28|nr:ABC transporter ATP-binding protein [Zwartia sp.]MDO9024241.1 ABC transporter ATP-binding protein [Zwartia sp.]
MNTNAPLLSINQVKIAYPRLDGTGWIPIVQDLTLSLARGSIACLLGPSGCGKSTILRAICGFESLQDGSISLHGKVVSAPDVLVAPNLRKVGMVFQDFALFPHLSVLENVMFGLRALSPAKRRIVGMQWLERVSLADKADAYPHELSGGQQQRVALARAMAPEPDLILLDEPFSSLDIDLRERLAGEMRDILKANGVTALLVTHDQFEAFAIADQIGVMSEGRIVQWDTPYDLYHEPTNRYVADFIGRGVFVKGIILPNASVKIELGQLQLDHDHHDPVGAEVDVLLRADDIQHDDASPLLAEVVRKTFRGADFLYTLRLPSGQEILAYVPSHHDHSLGEKIGIRLVVDHVVTFSD